MSELTGFEYWKLKAQLLEIELDIERYGREINNLVKQKNTILVAHNLEIGKNYRFHDETISIEEVK